MADQTALRPTDDTATEAELRDLFSMEPDDGALATVIPTCAGEWRMETPGIWRAWENPAW